uniref:Uncharacterized protein n=1 Tax=Arundo donax TaxID=35708 RepID=A0A0A9FGE7_ARUDO
MSPSSSRPLASTSPCSTTRSWPSVPSSPPPTRLSLPGRSPASSRSPILPSRSPSRPPPPSSLPASTPFSSTPQDSSRSGKARSPTTTTARSPGRMW